MLLTKSMRSAIGWFNGEKKFVKCINESNRLSYSENNNELFSRL